MIQLSLSSYDLVLGTLELRPSFAIYQTKYDLPLRDSCTLTNHGLKAVEIVRLPISFKRLQYTTVTHYFSFYGLDKMSH